MHSGWFRSTFLRAFQFPATKEWGPISLGELIIWSPLLYFNFEIFKDESSSSFIRFQCILHHSIVLLKFSQIKEWRDLISWGKSILQKPWLIWSPLLYFNFRTFKGQNSSSFNRFQIIRHNLGLLFSAFKHFHKLKRGHLISSGEPVLQKGWIIWSTLLYFNFESFKDRNSSSFIRFQSILHDSGVPFWDFWNFHKLKREVGDLISLGESILQKG